MDQEQKPIEKKQKGLARLQPRHRKIIATLGGLLNEDRHRFDAETASAAGKIGGKAKNPNKGFGTTRRKKPLEAVTND
jgi:hypothetical protein